MDLVAPPLYQPTPDSPWPAVAAIIGAFALATVVVAIVVWQRSSTARAKAVLAREKEYRELAEGSLAAQQRTERQLAEITERLDQVQSRLRSFERILREVE